MVTLRLRFEREIAWPFEKKNKMSRRRSTAAALPMLLDSAWAAVWSAAVVSGGRWAEGGWAASGSDGVVWVFSLAAFLVRSWF